MAVQTWGTLAPDGSNAVLVEHALTGDTHVVGPPGPGQPTAGWWPGLVGPGAAIDTDRWFVVATNVLGGCRGTTGPATEAADGQPWGSRFPEVTIRDQVRVEALVADLLGIPAWALVIGGSMGGMRAAEWVATYPDRARAAAVVAACGAATADQIAWGQAQTLAIEQDPDWRGGDYHRSGVSPDHGLGLARRIAHTTYRSAPELEERFGRSPQPGRTRCAAGGSRSRATWTTTPASCPPGSTPGATSRSPARWRPTTSAAGAAASPRCCAATPATSWWPGSTATGSSRWSFPSSWPPRTGAVRPPSSSRPTATTGSSSRSTRSPISSPASSPDWPPATTAASGSVSRTGGADAPETPQRRRLEMTVLVGFVPTAEGRAALTRAVDEARRMSTQLIVLDSGGGQSSELDAVVAEAEQSGVQVERRPIEHKKDPAEDIIAVSEKEGVDLIVIGLRRRTPVGKLILGSNAQRILLDAACPVLAVKADAAD
ncbi:alpha/beta fold hydrolase [Barrientosiimonas endolithica]